MTARRWARSNGGGDCRGGGHAAAAASPGDLWRDFSARNRRTGKGACTGVIQCVSSVYLCRVNCQPRPSSRSLCATQAPARFVFGSCPCCSGLAIFQTCRPTARCLYAYGQKMRSCGAWRLRCSSRCASSLRRRASAYFRMSTSARSSLSSRCRRRSAPRCGRLHAGGCCI